MKKERLLLSVTKGIIKFDMILLAVLAIVCYITPFASYTYRGEAYTISGLELLTGRSIMSGTVTINSYLLLWAGVVISILLIIVALIFSRMTVKTAGISILLIGVAIIVVNVIFTNQVKGILSEAKDPKVGFGSTILLIIGLLIVAKAFYLLYQSKTLSALDFMVLPGLLYMLINNYFPMIGIALAFKKIDFSLGLWGSKWIGLNNFNYLFTTKDAFIITRNTILYNLAFIVIGNIFGIVVGICLSEIFSKKLQKFFQTTILLPQLISMIIVSYIVYGFLSNASGWINLQVLGKDHTINFYSTTAYWPFILLFVNTWKGIGYSSIIYMSSIIGMDRSLYEASYVDGCGRWKQIKSITLPLLKPTIITLVLIQVGRIFYSDFGLFFQVPMDSGVLYSVTQTIDTYVYHSLMKTNNISMASAASAYQSVVGFVVIMTVNAIVRKLDRDNALF